MGIEKKTILITGSSGYLGSYLIDALAQLSWVKNIYGLDVIAPKRKVDRFQYYHVDITDYKAVIDKVVALKPDIAIHLAFIVNPLHDEKMMRRINVDGTQYFLDAVEKANVAQVMVASSGTAYGAWADNPVPLREIDPIRPHKDFAYAKDKAEVERLCEQFIKTHSNVVFSVIRPTVVCGKGVNNYLSDLLLMPVVPKIIGYNPGIQMVHEDDVVGAIIKIIETGAEGSFNIAPGDYLKISEVIKVVGCYKLPVPYFLARFVVTLAWGIRLKSQKFPPGFIDYMRFPWVIDNSRLVNELGYQFQYNTEQALTVLLERKNAPGDR